MLLILSCFIFFISTDVFSDEPAENEALTVQTTGSEWVVTKRTGVEQGLTFWTLDSKDKKTELGWIPSDNDCSGWVDRYLYNEDGSYILDDKDKEIKLKCESSKCSGMNCYHISLTNAAAINIDEYVQLGNNTIVTEYQNLSLINYNSDWFDVNVTLLMNLSGTWNTTANDVWVRHDAEKDKFGANVSRTEDTYFKYLVESDSIIKQQSELVYYITNPNECGFFCKEERHLFDFQDICNLKGGFDPECSFNKTDYYNLEITFIGQYNSTLGYIDVDPEIYVTNVSIGVFNNTIYNGTINSVQLNLSLSSNGTYTGVVQNFTSIPQSEGDTINVTTETTLPAGTGINVKIRNFLMNDNSIVALWMEKPEGTNWKNYGSGGDILDATVPAAITWGDETYNESYGTSGSLFHINPNPPTQLFSDPDVSPLDIPQNFTMCYWGNLTASSRLLDHGYSTPLGYRLECNGAYYMYAFGLSDEAWANNINGVDCDNGEWTFMCYGYNSSNFWGYRDGTFLKGDATTGMIGDFNDTPRIGLYADGHIAMLFVSNETKSKQWMDEVYNFTRITWEPYSSPCDVSINTTGCLFSRAGNFTQSKFTFTTENVSVTPLLHNYTYTIQNATPAAGGATNSANLSLAITMSAITDPNSAFKRKQTDALTIGSTISRKEAMIRQALLSTTITLVTDRLSVLKKALSQVITTLPTTSRKFLADRDISQAININAVISRIGVFGRNLSQVININAVISRLGVFNRDLSQAININTVISRLGVFSRDLSQAININIATSGVSNRIRSLFESITISALIDRTSFAFRTLSNTVSVQESIVRTGVTKYLVSIGEALNLNAIVVRTANMFRDISDTISFNIVTNRFKSFSRSISQNMVITPIVSRMQALIINISETISINNVINRISRLFINLNLRFSILEYLDGKTSGFRDWTAFEDFPILSGVTSGGGGGGSSFTTEGKNITVIKEVEKEANKQLLYTILICAVVVSILMIVFIAIAIDKRRKCKKTE